MKCLLPFTRALYCCCMMGLLTCLVPAYAHTSPSIQYATRTENVRWESDGSKFSCRLSHEIEGFGEAVFEREAGENTRFYLHSQMPRMQSGQAALVVRTPAWSATANTNALATVPVKESMSPIVINRKLSERMLAELQKGMLLDFKRKPLYGDPQVIKVTLSSIGFRKSHQRYLECLADLLPVNFKQIEKSSLYYDNDDDDLKRSVIKRLDQIVAYAKEDDQVKSFYLDGHTDSEGIRNENLIKSQRRTEKVMDYLVEKGIARERIIARWHGERYQVATNRTAKGRAKNRRVTLRVSKESPQTLLNSPELDSQTDDTPKPQNQ